MKTARRKPMQISVGRIVAAAGSTSEFEQSIASGKEFHLSVKNGSYQRLVIEVIGGTGHVSVAHVYQQNFDTMYDPEIVFNPDFKWSCIGITQSPVGRSRHLNSDQANAGYYLPGVATLADVWARNLRDQGFDSKDCEFSSLTCPSIPAPAVDSSDFFIGSVSSDEVQI